MQEAVGASAGNKSERRHQPAAVEINATIAASAGLNPIVSGLALTITIDAVILYPVQTAANLMAYEAGYFDRADVVKMGLGMLALTVAAVLLVMPYWALLGFPLTAQ